MTTHRTGEDSASEMPAPAESVTVRVDRETLVLRNESGRRVGCVVVDAEVMMIATYPPSGGERITLEPNTEVTVPFSGIHGLTAQSTAATLHWWPLRTQSESLGADDYTRTVAITLRS